MGKLILQQHSDHTHKHCNDGRLSHQAINTQGLKSMAEKAVVISMVSWALFTFCYQEVGTELAEFRLPILSVLDTVLTAEGGDF